MVNPIRSLVQQQPTRSDGNLMTMSTSESNVLMKQVMGTHLPDGRDVDVKILLNFIEDILWHFTINIDPISSGPHTNEDKLNRKPHKTNASVMLDSLSGITDRLACEMELTARDGHTTALALFQKVKNFNWGAKLILTLAAFSLNYRDLWLLANIYSGNELAKFIPTAMEHTAPLKRRLDALNKLVRSILELTRCIVQFMELPFMYITPDIPAVMSAIDTIPIAVYWSIRGIIMCATVIAEMTSMPHALMISSTSQSWELSVCTLKIDRIYKLLSQLLESCNRIVGDKKGMEFMMCLNQLFETSNIDNMKILKMMVTPRDNILPLFDGNTKKRVSLEFLRRRNVLLLISGVEISSEELLILEEIYHESHIHGARKNALYEVVWMPIVNLSVEYTDELDRKFKETRDKMPWYSVFHPSIIDKAVIRFIGDRWHFKNKPVIVVLDPQGKELSANAIHMMWIWGSNAFPFTSMKEELLWRDETWRLELLVGPIDITILNWIIEDTYIFLFGGDDIEWIRKFTTTARAMARAARIPLEMVYVGKEKENENVRTAISIISVEKLSHFWQEQIMMWFFWTRLESMLHSKRQLKREDDEDPLVQHIMKLLSYENDGYSWALLCRGSEMLTDGHGTTMMQTLADFEMWKEDIGSKGFDLSFTGYHDKLQVAA